MSVEVNITHDNKLKAYTIRFTYNKWSWNQVSAVIELLKVYIPASDRIYDPASKEWTVTERYWILAEKLFKEAQFPMNVEEIVNPEDYFYNQGIASSAPVSKEQLANKLLDILGISAEELADFNRAKKAYRRKALELHPDRNSGDGSKMSELNSIWSSYNAN